jgi:hypothetical protein
MAAMSGRDTLARLQADPFLHHRVISIPFGQPVGGKAHRGGRDQHGLANRARRQLLFPHGDLYHFARRGDHGDHHRRAQEAAAFFLDLPFVGPVGLGGLGQDIAGPDARLAFEDDEAPGKQLAVIGHAGGAFQDVGKLVRRGAGARHCLGRAGAAAEQQVQRAVRGLVEGRNLKVFKSGHGGNLAGIASWGGARSYAGAGRGGMEMGRRPAFEILQICVVKAPPERTRHGIRAREYCPLRSGMVAAARTGAGHRRA